MIVPHEGVREQVVPSLLPKLRDLAEVSKGWRLVVEVDLDSTRLTGPVTEATYSSFYVQETAVQFTEVIAFRIIDSTPKRPSPEGGSDEA